MPVRVEHDRVGSTQAEAVRLVRLGGREGTLVVAREQTDGRGRLDRAWASPRGGLYLSMVVALPRRSPGLLPLAVGAELRDGLHRDCGADLRVKWPNDLVVDEGQGRLRKLAGILIDRIRTESDPNLAVVGLGINVRRPPTGIPAELRPRIAFLEEFGESPPELERVESTAVRAVAAAARRVARPGGAAAVASECRRYLYGVGHPVTVDGVPVGVLRTVEDDGAATVERDGILSTIYAGDLGVGAPA